MIRITMLSPAIKLIYFDVAENGENIKLKEETVWGFIPMDKQTQLDFPIDLYGYPIDISYDMVENNVIRPDDTSYKMLDFQLLKLEEENAGIFTGTLIITNTDESVTTVKLIGRMLGPSLPKGVDFIDVPK